MSDYTALTGRINEIANGFEYSQILFVANEANVFAHTASPATAQTVADALGWDRRGVRMLLDGLVAMDLLVKNGDTYTNTEVASTCLAPGGPAYQGDILRHKQHGYFDWGKLAECVRTGTGVPREGREQPPEELRDFILGMSNIGVMSAQQILGRVDLSRYRRVLDVGGGPATYSIAFLNAHPDMCATLFDLPPVVEIAREQVAAADLMDRFSFVGGDYNVDGLGTGYDLVLVSNIVHSLGPERCRALVRKCYDALEPGGTLILKDFIVDAGRPGPPFSLVFALHMLVMTGEGDTYTAEEVASWTDAAGFAPGRMESITPQTRLWIVEKAG